MPRPPQWLDLLNKSEPDLALAALREIVVVLATSWRRWECEQVFAASS
jgi:hypothetical protein